MTQATVSRIYPAPMVAVSLSTLYLDADLRRGADRTHPFLYTNFIASLDGRVAVRGLGEAGSEIPPTIANANDWRLYQELAAQADAVIVSAGHARAMARDESLMPFPFTEAMDTCDLKRWRCGQGLPESPALAIVTGSLNVPFDTLVSRAGTVIVVTGQKAPDDHVQAAKDAGADVLRTPDGARVTGRYLAQALAEAGYVYQYSVAGPGVMKTLLRDRVLDRLYLTQVQRLIGGASFDTLVETSTLKPPVDLVMVSLFEDQTPDMPFAQTYAAYDVV